ncbi:hypothetical protein GALL_475890 [mine drainage metagenome]|uniref:Uncharacterized protein n=1 Tax=mine drainage metagenome TaxID=410659 RepID=A0A1J5PHV3_9ZZZZ
MDAVELRTVTDVYPGRADGHALIAVDAIAGGLAKRPQLARLLQRRTLFAAIVLVGDVERPLIGEGCLDARPRAHVDADLLPHEACEQIGGRRQYRDPDIGQHRCLEGHKLLHQRRRIIEVEHPGATGPPRDQQPDRMLQRNLGETLQLPRAARRLAHALAAVTFDHALDRIEQIRPYRLRTKISAPDAAADRIHQKQRDGGDDQQPGKIIHLLWPQLDEEEIEPTMREIDEDGLVRQAGSPIPAYERQQIIDAEHHAEDCPFDPAKPALNGLRIDLLAGFVEWAFDDGFVHGCRRSTMFTRDPQGAWRRGE